jgi:cytoskeletal protein CcmA (bactofilin family)
MNGDKESVIDAQADFEGTLKGKDARILGRFRGQIELSGRLLLGEGSKVDAKVKADSAEIGGNFNGDLSVRSLTLLEKSKVEGTLAAQKLAVREGAQLNGSVNTSAEGKAGAHSHPHAPEPKPEPPKAEPAAPPAGPTAS